MSELLSKDFLKSIGITLDEQTYAALSHHYEKTLNQRVIDEITEELDEQQLMELSVLQGTGTNVTDWLKLNIPQLDEIIEDEVAILMGEIAEESDNI